MALQADPIAFQFTEDMRGFVTFAQTNFQDGYDQGRRDGTALMFHLTLKTDDLDRFLSVPEHEARAEGYVEAAALGGRCPVETGTFNLFVDSADADRKTMSYRLFFRDRQGKALTLSGHKQVQEKPGFDVWQDTTTLFTNLFAGHIGNDQEAASTVQAAGILRISVPDFMTELTTVRAFAPSFPARLAAVERFTRFFLG
jgi:cholesterol oxidase